MKDTLRQKDTVKRGGFINNFEFVIFDFGFRFESNLKGALVVLIKASRNVLYPGSFVPMRYCLLKFSALIAISDIVSLDQDAKVQDHQIVFDYLKSFFHEF